MTWDFLAHMVVLVVQYAMPMNRLATLLSTDAKRFSAGGLARMLRYVAQRFAPIYLCLFDALADSDILCGDDTSCRVTEVSRRLADLAAVGSPAWHSYRNVEAAQAQLAKGDKSLAAMLAAELGFEFERRTGDGTKKALHTTTISGRSEGEDPRSLIVLFRSHLGGFGNLLETLLCKRSPQRKALTIQSDLSTVNLVADSLGAINWRGGGMRIPDAGTLPGIPFGIIIACATSATPWRSLTEGLIGVAAGYLIVRAIADAYYYTTGREGLGLGLAKMLAVIGAFYGWKALPLAVLFMSLVGFVVYVPVLLAAERRRQRQGLCEVGDTEVRRTEVPAGHLLAIGGYLGGVLQPVVLQFVLPLLLK